MKNARLIITGGLSLLFAFLFYQKHVGVNLLLFQILLWAAPFILKQFHKTDRMQRLMAGGSLVAIIGGFYSHTLLAGIVSSFSILMFCTVCNQAGVRSIHKALGGAIANLFSSFVRFNRALFGSLRKSGLPVPTFSKSFRYVIPLIIVLVFFGLYSGASPKFSTLTASIGDFLADIFNSLFSNLDFGFILMIVFGLLVTSAILYTGTYEWLSKDSLEGNRIRRRRTPYRGKPLGLRSEARMGTGLLVTLNAMCLVVVFGEITDVWFGFNWTGQTLKQFVHAGLYQLVLAILISAGIALYFFRSNQNFYSKNKSLRMMTYLWLGQNAILVISSAIRNGYYIQHFALAYKRIALMFFLAACLFGLIFIMIKITKRYNSLYLFRVNGLTVYGLFLIGALFNWDVIIANYNFANSERAYVELSFLSELNDSALPYLDQTPEVLSEISTRQESSFSFNSSSYEPMANRTYSEILQARKKAFIDRFENQTVLEWNPAESKAYFLLKSKELNP